jgi:hypothetical protein
MRRAAPTSRSPRSTRLPAPRSAATAARSEPTPRSPRRARGGKWRVETSAGPIEAGAGQCRRRLGRRGRGARGSAGLGLEPRRRTVVQLRVGRRGLRDLPFVTDLHESFYFKGEGDNSVWVCPLDETLVDPCDAAPEEIDVAMAIDRFERRSTGRSRRSSANGRACGPSRPTGDEVRLRPRSPRAFSGASGRAAWASRPRRRRPCCAPR